MIDLCQKARAGRTRALSVSRLTNNNVFFETPMPGFDRQARTRTKTDRLIGDTMHTELQMAS